MRAAETRSSFLSAPGVLVLAPTRTLAVVMSDRNAQSNAAATVVIAIGLAVLAVVHLFGSYIIEAIGIAEIAVPSLAGLWLLVVIVRFAWASPATRRNYPRLILARARWRWLTRNLGLAYADPHGKTKHRGAFGPSIGSNVRIEKTKGRVRYPKARFRADDFGIVGRIKTTPKAGRAEFDKASVALADEWRVRRVQVSQVKPGRLIVRGLVNDPLVTPFGPEGAPAGTYTGYTASSDLDFRPYLGRDEWGQHRYVDLSGITGMSIAGLPGFGKTSLVLSLLCQLASSAAVQFVFIDGKGGGDYADWAGRAWLACGDELAEASGHLEDVHSLMRRRLALVGQDGGPRNRWHVGPTPDYPLIVTVIDECHTFYDLDAVKGDKQAEPMVRACRSLTGQLVKKGRSVLFLTILLTQKQTSDAVPTAIRDNCALGFSFAVKTRDAAVAGLGEGIRDYPSYCPTGLRERPAYIGVATSTLPSGSDPFCRVRVPEISEEAASARARETEGYRADPERLHGADLPVLDPVTS